MCGFVGIWDKKGRVTEELLKAAGREIEHRGPDHQGIYLQNNVGFVHQRLAIIDLEERSNQPMRSASGRYTLVFNGEIYNYKNLRSELEEKGIRLTTKSDTEVLLKLLEAEGESCLAKLDGMFAFCVYDSEDNSWFFARDRMGIKPLYYAVEKDLAIVTSDLKSLQSIPFHPKVITQNSIWKYLHYGYFPQPETVYDNVFKLLPGHFAKLDKDFKLSIHRYWDIPNGTSINNNHEEQFKDSFSKAVKKRLISDVEVGASSSGGLDSSSIISLMKQDGLKTFTIGFEHQSNTLDLERSSQLAQEWGLDQHTSILPVKCLDDCDDLFAKLDEPISEASIFSLWFNFYQAKRKGVKVILGGDGADEVLGGYNYFEQLDNFSKYANIPKPILGGAQSISTGLLSGFANTSKLGKLRDIVFKQTLDLYKIKTLPLAHQYTSSQKNQGDLIKLGLKELNAIQENLMQSLYENGEESWTQLLYVEQKTTLVNKHLAKVDKASMMNSVEARVPFLDHKLVELCYQLPDDHKRGKRVLKNTISDQLPRNIISDKKRGFNLPIKQWVIDYVCAEDDWKDTILNELPFISEAHIDDLKNQMLKGRKDTSRTLWSLFVLSRWLKHNQYQIR